MLQNRTFQVKIIKDDTRPAVVGNPHPKPGEKDSEDKTLEAVNLVMQYGLLSYVAVKSVNLAFKVAEHKLIGS